MIAVAALARRDFLLQRSYRLAFLFDVLWGVVDIVVWYFVSRVVGEPSTGSLAGAPTYFSFVVAGVIASLIVGSATSEITYRIRDDQVAGTLETLLAQPIRAWELAVGTAAFPFAFAIVRSALYLLVAVVALDLPTAGIDWVGVAVMLVLSGAAFVGLGFVAAAVTIVVKRGGGVVGTAVYAMTLLSGAMFPISVMPGWLQAIGKVMPTRPAFDGLRDALFTGGGWGRDALALAVIAALLAPLGVAALSLSLRLAKRHGSLAQY